MFNLFAQSLFKGVFIFWPYFLTYNFVSKNNIFEFSKVLYFSFACFISVDICVEILRYKSEYPDLVNNFHFLAF